MANYFKGFFISLCLSAALAISGCKEKKSGLEKTIKIEPIVQLIDTPNNHSYNDSFESDSLENVLKNLTYNDSFELDIRLALVDKASKRLDGSLALLRRGFSPGEDLTPFYQTFLNILEDDYTEIEKSVKKINQKYTQITTTLTKDLQTGTQKENEALLKKYMRELIESKYYFAENVYSYFRDEALFKKWFEKEDKETRTKLEIENNKVSALRERIYNHASKLDELSEKADEKYRILESPAKGSWKDYLETLYTKCIKENKKN